MLNALINQLFVLICAVIYWKYYVPSAVVVDILGAVVNNASTSTLTSATVNTSSAYNGSPALNLSGAPLASISLAVTNYTVTNFTGNSLNKIDPVTLFASVGTLIAVWMMAVLSLSLTVKKEYLHTFWSTQNGCAFARSFFLDGEGEVADDARRIMIFFFNERQWASILVRVKQWVLSMYATWEALKPAWFTDSTKALIPDQFLPTEALQRENARAPGGRRQTLQNAGRLRSMSVALGSSTVKLDADAAAAFPVLSSQPIGGEEDVVTAQPDQQPCLAQPLLPVTATTSSQGAARPAPSGEAAVVDIEPDNHNHVSQVRGFAGTVWLGAIIRHQVCAQVRAP